jgi:S1-C subfamily serine protease
MLITPAATVVFAADILGPSAGSVNQLQALGSVKDYVGGDSGSVGDSEDQVPILGIEITNGQSRLARGPSVGGIKIISVNPDGPAAIAGLQSEHTAVRTALTATLAAGGMFFPPAMFGAILMGQSDVGESHDLIIAVDGERTRDIADLQDALDRADDGETVYLVILRAGHLQHIAVRLPGELAPYHGDRASSS